MPLVTGSPLGDDRARCGGTSRQVPRLEDPRYQGGAVMSDDARRGWTRRDFMAASAATTAAAATGLLPGLGRAAVPTSFDGSKFQLKAPEANPKSGGVLRYGITSRAPHFDVHQSGTINNLGS